LPSSRTRGWEDRLPLVGTTASVLLQHGIYEGKFFQRWIAELLEAKGITRFGQLVNEEGERPEDRYRLRVIASDVTHRRMLVLPNDADHLGIDPDELEIAYAVRMSMSIPIFFEPVVHTNASSGEEHLIVDGGMLSNFPVWLFDCEGRDPRWPTFGLLLVEPDPKVPIGHRLAAAGGWAKSRLADRLCQEPCVDDDGSSRPPLPRKGDFCPHDPYSDARNCDDRIQHRARTCTRALRLGLSGRVGVP